MKKQIIDFKHNEYHSAKREATNRLNRWQIVKQEVEKLIELPKTKKQYDVLLDSPLEYVKNTLEALHRPSFNGLPISTEKILSMLEIDLTALELSIKEMNKHKGKLTFVVGNGVTTVVRKEDFQVYTQNENQLKQYKALQNLVEVSKAIFKNGKLPEFNMHHLAKFTDNRLHINNGTLEPNPFHIQQIK
ncbi:hypothetical protein A5M85_05895 [Cellulophaga lytica]|uniref:hypothetical protein n=1 Tax=Cellulophaga lytica TaxID=979 RepID=UPI0009505B11|nr:hypothetical protein [Cellulophaga lytica]APU09827.1 hypothetical protein A5M85_05895 [Cellulophaga lytica]